MLLYLGNLLKTTRKDSCGSGDNDGNAKVAIDKIEKGILKDGQNFKTEDHFFKVGGEGQPSEKGVELFALELSEYIGCEVKGVYFSEAGSESTTGMTIGRYSGNNYTKSFSNGMRAAFISKSNYTLKNVKGFFHTHPQKGYSYDSRSKAAPADIVGRDRDLKRIPGSKFYILTRPYGYSSGYVKIDYTE